VTAAILTEEHRTILRMYAGGSDITGIVNSCNLSQDLVSGVVSRLAGFNRGRAKQLLLDHAHQSRTPPVAPAAPKPEIVVTVEPATAAPTYEGLLDRAESSGDLKLEKLAAKARELLDELDDRLTAFEAAKEALAEIAELEAKLEAARSKLISRRPSQRERTGPDPKAVRAWAAANGVEVPAHGRVGKAAIVAYLAAQGPS
jgi:hypothetical protein